MNFPMVSFPSVEDAKKCLRLADPCGGRLYLSHYLNCAWLILRDSSLIWRGCEDEFFITQDEFDKVRIIKYDDDYYVVKFPDEPCYWDDRRFRNGPKYQIEDGAIELSLHYHACQNVKKARAQEKPRPIYYVDEERLARARSIADAEAAFIAEGGINADAPFYSDWSWSRIPG